jgi:radical S-adenosyl methionine domain-containing protein 2
MPTPIPSVNYHLWEPCNMKCKFCFATFQDVKQTILPKGHLSREESLLVVDALIAAGFEKITFAGGEPTLCKWLDELIMRAKEGGMTTMIVTNGVMLTDTWLARMQGHLDWVTISIDTLDPAQQIAMGRVQRGKPVATETYEQIIAMVKKYGIRFKLNTVVSAANYTDNMSDFVLRVAPERWKIFQVLPIKGQNDAHIDDFVISNIAFDTYITRHNWLNTAGVITVPENNTAMTSSYAMVDPAGRFYDNSLGELSYSQPILKVGVTEALQQVTIDVERFTERDGVYNWK